MPRQTAMAPALVGAFAVAATFLTPARALPPPGVPPSAPTASPTPTPNGAAYLAVGSPLDFVLDDPVDSKKTPQGAVVRVHLAKALVVGGRQLAPAGSPDTLKVVSTRPALSGDQDGTVELELNPLLLPGHGALPVSLTRSFLTVEQSAGKQSTRDVMDTVEDVLIPGHVIYRALRKGHELTLPRGTIVRARTEASVDASRPPAVVIATPAPFQLNTDVPHASFTAIPLYTLPTPPPRPTAVPSSRPLQ